MCIYIYIYREREIERERERASFVTRMERPYLDTGANFSAAQTPRWYRMLLMANLASRRLTTVPRASALLVKVGVGPPFGSPSVPPCGEFWGASRNVPPQLIV